MKYSLRRQMTAVFIGLLVFILGAVFIVNSGFLQQYYVSHKAQDLVETYQVIDRALQNESLTTQSVQEIAYQAEKTNIDMTVIDDEGHTVLATVTDGNPLFQQMFRYVFNKNDNSGSILKRNSDYVICKTTDPENDTDYLEMWGSFTDGYFFTMRSPLASIRESAALANQFLIYLGVTGAVLGGILVWFFARRITRPIMELAKLSESMADLNFDEKYTSGGSNEIGILEGLKEGVNDDPESREFYCDVIMDEAGKMNRMVKNLLTLNQLEFGADEVEFTRFDIVSLVKGVIASCDILIQQAGAEVDFIADETAYVWADEFKTEQVVRNYLTNAIHHVENEKRIEVRVIKTGDKVRVTVFNSGKPIPEEDVPKLWDKFYKVDKAHTREYGGNGIGLSIVKAIMDSFHQKYGVNNFDNGVEFWFELDAKDNMEVETTA